MAEYAPDQGGVCRPEIPEHCPHGADGSRCRMAVHGIRRRKTGPGHALVVVVCRTHGCFFTLYPPGYVPYSRMPVSPVGCDDMADFSGWKRTIFVAAVVAMVGGAAWPREGGGGPCFRTQRRQIERAAQWLGLRSPRPEAEAVAYCLDVTVMDHCVARNAYRTAHGFRGRAAAVGRVLKLLKRDRSLLPRVLRSGHRTGVCGQPWWWRPGRGYAPSFPRRERRPTAGG